MKPKITENPTLIDKTINELGKKYEIENPLLWHREDNLRAFLNELKQRVKKINYNGL